MARRKRSEGMEQRWVGDAESVWSGMADWRAAHPKATLSEIEAALDARLDRLRARLLAAPPCVCILCPVWGRDFPPG